MGSLTDFVVGIFMRYKYQNHPQLRRMFEGRERAKLRLGGDGSEVARQTNAIGVHWACVNLGPSCHQDRHLHTFAVANGKENYEGLRDLIGSFSKEMQELQDHGIRIDGRTIRIEWELCADLKFLHCVLGQKGSLATHFCPFCVVNKHAIHSEKVSREPSSIVSHFS